MNNKSKFLIVAANSGAGKTTLTLGLLRALSNRGLVVQPFKCGPDYIDTKLHEFSSGEESVNLDLFMASENHVVNVFDEFAENAEVSIVEGAMGLFDGYSKMKGSAAEIAKLLDIPIVLVVNAKAAAYSVAALLYGFKNFDPELNVIGAVFNFVGSESHYSFLKDACDDVGIESLGYLPKNLDFEIPSRHLGLNTDRHEDILQVIDSIADVVEDNINIDKLLELSQYNKDQLKSYNQVVSTSKLKIAVAKDEAFNFTYRVNISALERLGEVCFFSPLHDKELPITDFVYIPGGYPELYAKPLSENKSMQQSIRNYVESGGKLWAECGGMMYLMSELITSEGNKYPMVGLFNGVSSMENMKLSLGYRYFTYKDIELRGHEFHYSATEIQEEGVAQLYGAKNQPVPTKLLRYKNALAGYTHIYWADQTNWFKIFN